MHLPTPIKYQIRLEMVLDTLRVIMLASAFGT